MRRIRRTDNSPRVEMMPLIDVIFLLLTFFIYAMVTMAPPPRILPVPLARVGEGGTGEEALGAFHAITVDRTGQIYWDRDPVFLADLAPRLADLVAREPQTRLFLAMERVGGTGPTQDRGPLLVELIALVQRSGIQHFSIVGAEEPS